MRSAKFVSIEPSSYLASLERLFDFVLGFAVAKASGLATVISFVLFDRGQRKFCL